MILFLFAGSDGKEPKASSKFEYPVVENSSWKQGEELTYKLTFGLFNAGTASFSVKDGGLYNSRPVYLIQSALQSAKWFFYKIDDVNTSITDKSGLFTWKYVKRQREGDYVNDENADYDHEKGVFVRNDDGNVHDSEAFEPFSRDVLNVIYYVRTLDLEVGKKFAFPVHDARRGYTMIVDVKKKEKVKVPAGSFECFLVAPQMFNKDGSLKKKGQLTLWITTDQKRIPVKFDSALKIGSITGSLTHGTGTN